jgi:hypothetical protein
MCAGFGRCGVGPRPVEVSHRPLTFEICRGIHDLDLSNEPTDEIIASTSIAHRVSLVTRDGKIRKVEARTAGEVRSHMSVSRSVSSVGQRPGRKNPVIP